MIENTQLEDKLEKIDNVDRNNYCNMYHKMTVYYIESKEEILKKQLHCGECHLQFRMKDEAKLKTFYCDDCESNGR